MILVLLAHPDPASFNYALATAVNRRLEARCADVQRVDLYRVSRETGRGPFPAALEREELLRKTSLEPFVLRQMSMLEEARGYVVIHPDWWGGPPAVLKGWIDRVMRPETAYTTFLSEGRLQFQGLLEGRRAMVIVTGDGEAGPLESFWAERVWGFCGVSARIHYIASPGRMSSLERRQSLEEAATHAESWLQPAMFQEPSI